MREQELIWLDTAENPEGQMELTVKYRGKKGAENAEIFLEIRDKKSILVKKKGEFAEGFTR